MRKNFLRFTFFLLATCYLLQAFAFTIPARPENYVNDYANILSPQTKEKLNQQLANFENTSSNQLVVVTIPNLGGLPIEDYSIKLAERWKIGTKQNDNGIILLISKAEHKIRIEVGYGLEGALPDAVANLIIQNEIRPEFQANNFDQGVANGVNAIIAATQNEYHATPKSNSFTVQNFIFTIILLWIVFSILARIISALRTGIYYSLGKSARIHTPFWDALATYSIFRSGSSGGGSSGGFSGGFGGGGGGGFGGGGASGGW